MQSIYIKCDYCRKQLADSPLHSESDVKNLLEERSWYASDEFHVCPACQKVFKKMKAKGRE